MIGLNCNYPREFDSNFDSGILRNFSPLTFVTPDAELFFFFSCVPSQ